MTNQLIRSSCSVLSSSPIKDQIGVLCVSYPLILPGHGPLNHQNSPQHPIRSQLSTTSNPLYLVAIFVFLLALLFPVLPSKLDRIRYSPSPSIPLVSDNFCNASFLINYAIILKFYMNKIFYQKKKKGKKRE